MSTISKDSSAFRPTESFIARDTAAEAKAEEPLAPHRKRKLFVSSGAILGNEFCERLAYYGLQTNMSLYLKQYMGYSSAEASQLLQVWKATVYLTPLLGALLADAYLGRYWVIISFSSLYFLGMLGVTLVNLIPAIKPQLLKAPQNGYNTTRGIFWAMMYLVAIGSGGIKPCVSSFGADQFRDDSARERKWRSSFFNWFYFSINVGSLIATLVVVPIQTSLGYGIGFGIPTIAFAVAICIFLAATPLYTRLPPEGSPLTRIYQVFAGAVSNRSQVVPNDPAELYEPADAKDTGVTFRMIHTDGMKCLDKAAMLPKGGVASKGHQCTVTQVEETKAFVRIMPIFLCVCIYQMAYDPIFTFLPYPGDQMNRQMGSVKIPASSISFANTFGVLFTVTFYDIVIVPLTTKFNRPISMTMRIGIGFFLEMLALISAAVIETSRLSVDKNAGIPQAYTADPRPDCDDVGGTPEADGGDGSCKYYTDPQYISPMSIWWQVIPYFLLGASEVFTNIGTMELFYTQVSPGMRSLGTSFYLLTVCIGTYLAVALNLIIDGATGGTWVASNPIFAQYNLYMWVNVGIIAVGLGVFFIIARGYVEKPILDSDEDPFNTETRLHGDLANVSRTWPSIRKESRHSELRKRSALATASGLGSAPGSRMGSSLATRF